VALPSCEAEFMVSTATVHQALWFQGLLTEITGLKEQKVKFLVDNKSSTELMKNLVSHGKSMQISIRYHFIREYVERNQVKMEYVPGQLQHADILAKTLARIKLD
jgi:spore coat polysaccharide biosynthesis protein SpsF (cytidylyltransferase family)